MEPLPPYGTKAYYQELGRRGGKARASQPGFIDHQRRAGQRSAEVNDMAALGSRGARAFIKKYGYIRFFNFWRNWKLNNPSRHERQVAKMLDDLGFGYEREAQVLGKNIPVAVDFYLPDANDTVIEVNGRVHYDPLFDHPNRPNTRQSNDETRLKRLERSGFRVLVIDYRDLARPQTVKAAILEFLLS